MAISALALLIIAFTWFSPGYKRIYSRIVITALIEYFFSSSIMIVLIPRFVASSDIAALMSIFGINACMILFGALQEKYAKTG